MDLDLTAWGLPALFLLSFLAATVAPVGSEWLLVVLLLQGSDPLPAVAVASVGNFLGACTTYAVGKMGRDWLEGRGKLQGAKRYAKAEKLFLRYGTWSLLLTWVPIVGDALCLVAGVFSVNLLRFSVFTFAGKTARYAAVALAVL